MNVVFLKAVTKRGRDVMFAIVSSSDDTVPAIAE